MQATRAGGARAGWRCGVIGLGCCLHCLLEMGEVVPQRRGLWRLEPGIAGLWGRGARHQAAEGGGGVLRHTPHPAADIILRRCRWTCGWARCSSTAPSSRASNRSARQFPTHAPQFIRAPILCTRMREGPTLGRWVICADGERNGRLKGHGCSWRWDEQLRAGA
jgi:hypothetical protein